MTNGFLKDMLKYLPAQIAPGIVGFFSIPIVTKLFHAEDYGYYSLVMASIMVFTTLSGWLPLSIVRFSPAYERDKKLDVFYGSIIEFTLITIFSLTLIFIILLLIIRKHIPSKLYFLFFVGIGVFIIGTIFNVLQYFLRYKRQVSWYSLFAVWRSLVGFGLALTLIYLCKFGIESLLWGIILSIFIILPFLWRKSVGNVSIIYPKANFSLAKEMAKYSFPLVIGNLSAWILSLSDRYILEFFRSSQEVGIYSASYNISERSIKLITTLFMLASGPILMHNWEKKGKSESREFLNKITRYYLIFCIPAVVGLSALSKPLVKIMTGEQYFEGYKIIPFVTLGVLFLGLQHMFQSGFLLYKKTNFVSFIILTSGLLNLLLNFLFVPNYGFYAAAITTLISYSFLLFLMIILSRRFFVWKFPLKSLIKATCASAIMGIVVYSLANNLATLTLVNLILSICIGMTVYFLMLLLMKEFSHEEIRAIRLFQKR
ncbi:MAG: lipopolysaccharide biosynthesis protein [Candidatus Helarchaeota archaeon]